MNGSSIGSNLQAGKKGLKDIWIHAAMILITCICVLPFILIFIISISDEKTVLIQGYSFLPSKLSMNAYRYLFINPDGIIRAYSVTIFITLIGTSASVFIGSMLAYVISRKDYPQRNAISFYIFFTLLFNGGLVPWYLVYSAGLHLRDSILALIIPNLLLNGFNILIMRSFLTNTIEPSLIESAYLDGAGEFRIYYSIILPLSLPMLATMGLMTTLAYWNDWYNCLIFINNSHLESLQYLMTKVLLNIQFLQSVGAKSPELARLIGEMPSETIRMAMAIVGIGPILLAYPFFQKYFVRGLTIGAVKG